MAEERKATSLNLSLPAPMKAFIEAQVVRGHYGSASEYVRHLVRDAQKRSAEEERLEALLIEGLESGPGIEADEKFWRERRAKLEAFIAKRRITKKPTG